MNEMGNCPLRGRDDSGLSPSRTRYEPCQRFVRIPLKKKKSQLSCANSLFSVDFAEREG